MTSTSSAVRYAGQSSVAGILWMVAAAGLFSIAFSIVRYLSPWFSTFEITFFAQVVGALIVLPWRLRHGLGAVHTRRFPLHLLRSLTAYGGMLAGYYSLMTISLAESIALQFTLPVWTAILAALFLGERVTMHRWLAIGCGFIGVLVILKPGFADISIGTVAALAAAATYAASDTASRAVSSTDRPPVTVLYGFVILVPVSAIPAAATWVTPTLDQVPVIVVFGIFALGAQWCLAKSFSLADASLVSPVLFLRLPFLATIGYFVFGQVTDLFTWIGAAIIFVATYLLARREARAAKRDGRT
jgi:drug/metabolite transporter (DMT)-like permease